MSPPGCQKMSAKPCSQNAEESCPVLSLQSGEQKPPNPLLIQDKDVLQPTSGPYGLSRTVGPYDLSLHARACALGTLGPTSVGARSQRRGQARPTQAPAHQPEGKSEVAPQPRRGVHRP